MIDLVPFAGAFIVAGLLMIPVALVFQMTLNESAVGTFTMAMFIVLMIPIGLGIRHAVYTSTVTGWTISFAYTVSIVFAGLGLTAGFLQFGRD